MSKNKVVYLLGDENKWSHVLGQIANIRKRQDIVIEIAVIVVDTAILSTLKTTVFDDFKKQISELSNANVSFFACNNTLNKYGIPADMLLPQFTVVTEGGAIKAITLQNEGYYLFALE